jgi:hypothetical protein
MSRLHSRNAFLHAGRGLILALCTVFLVAGVVAEDAPAKPASVRPEVGKPLGAAQESIKAKNGKEALARLQEADAVANKTAYESYLIERLRGQAASMAGDAGTAARAFENAANSELTKANERAPLLAAAAGQYYVAKNYAKTAELIARYQAAGGNDPAMRSLKTQALYLSGEYAAVATELQAELQGAAGQAPAEDRLQLLANACLKAANKTCYADAMEMLVAHYPKPDYWAAVVYSVATAPGFSERLSLDLARLKLATHTLRLGEEYMEAAQRSLQLGFPAEAKTFVDRGYEAKKLGTGAEAGRHARLRELVQRNLAEDSKTLGQDDSRLAAAKDGIGLFNAGFNHVLHGNADKGLRMLEDGLKKGGIKRLDEARLQLGYAYYLAGRKDQAAQVFRSIRGNDGDAAIARLWLLHLR